MQTTTATNISKTEVNPDGHQIGGSATEKVAFHGKSPVAMRSGAAQAAVATTAAATGSYGYAEAQANALIALVNEIRAVMVEKGLMKGSA